MNLPLSFSAACSQLGNATINMVQATWRAPFTGGKIRMVAIGLPVLFATTATGIMIYRLARSILRSLGTSWENCLNRPADPRIIYDVHYISPIPLPSDEQATEAKPLQALRIERIPLPEESAKERNAALIKLIQLVDDIIIDPWILENKTLLEKGQEIDPLFKAMINSREELRTCLRSIALWQLCIQWEKGEALYLQGQLPPPPSLETISQEIRALKLKDEAQTILLDLVTPLQGDETAENKVLPFQQIALRVGYQQGVKLGGLAIRLHGILTHKPKSGDDVLGDKNKALYEFAVGMNEVVANSFVQVAQIISGMLRAKEKLSPQKEERQHHRQDEGEGGHQDVPHPIPPPQVTERQQQLQSETEVLIKTVSKALCDDYSTPLYNKHQKTWEEVATEGLQENSPISTFLKTEQINGQQKVQMTDTALLTDPSAADISTQQLAGVFFLHAMTIMESKQEFKGFIQRIPEELLRQIQPTLVNLIDKSMGVIKGINLERTIVRMFEFVGEILECCEAVKTCNVPIEDVNRSFMGPNLFPDDSSLAKALQKGKIEENRSGTIATLAGTTQNIEKQGPAIIKKLGAGAHKNVASYHQDPKQVEKDWVARKIVELKTLIRANTTDYDGQWLLSLLKSKGMGTQAGWIRPFLSFKDQIQTFSPVLASIFEILVGGVQSFIETKGTDAVQKGIEDISSPGILSTLIATTMMKSFLDLSKEDTEWQAKLSLLQQMYLFLSPKEKELINEHLKFLYQGEKLNERTKELTARFTTTPALELLEKETDYLNALADLEKANKELQKEAKTNDTEIQALQRAYDDLQRNLSLTQFERVKGLVLFVIGEKLKPTFAFLSGSTFLGAIMPVIEGAFDLLRHKKIVKHLIFTGVDLLIKELEITSGLKPAAADTFESKMTSNNSKSPSIFEIGEAHGFNTDLMNKIATFASNCNREGASGWLATFNYTFSNWTGSLFWMTFKNSFNENTRITSKDIADKVSEKFFNFGKDPHGLSAMIIEALTEHVADPRSK